MFVHRQAGLCRCEIEYALLTCCDTCRPGSRQLTRSSKRSLRAPDRGKSKRKQTCRQQRCERNSLRWLMPPAKRSRQPGENWKTSRLYWTILKVNRKRCCTFALIWPHTIALHWLWACFPVARALLPVVCHCTALSYSTCHSLCLLPLHCTVLLHIPLLTSCAIALHCLIAHVPLLMSCAIALQCLLIVSCFICPSVSSVTALKEEFLSFGG